MLKRRTNRKNNKLYESIMRDVAKVVKRHLNEMANSTNKMDFRQFLNANQNWDYAVDYNDDYWTEDDQTEWVNSILSDPDGKIYLMQLAFIDYITYYLGMNDLWYEDDAVLAEYIDACKYYPELKALTPNDWRGLNWGAVDENRGLDPDHYDVWCNIIKDLINGNNHFISMNNSPVSRTSPTRSTKVNSSQSNNFWQQFQAKFGISESQLINELDNIMGDSGEPEDSSDSLYLLLDNLNWDINNFKKLSNKWYKVFKTELINYYNEIPEDEDEMDITQNISNTFESFPVGKKYKAIFESEWGWWILYNLYGWSDTFGVQGGSGWSPARLKELINLTK